MLGSQLCHLPVRKLFHLPKGVNYFVREVLHADMPYLCSLLEYHAIE